MVEDDSTAALAQLATTTLHRLAESGNAGCPDGGDRFTWSADVLDELDELARTVGQLAEAVARTSGDDCDDVRRLADQLATAIVAHRNSLLRYGQGPASSPRRREPHAQSPHERSSETEVVTRTGGAPTLQACEPDAGVGSAHISP